MQALLPDILHLTHVNPHVASALPQCSGAIPLACMARQAGGTPTCERACTAGRAGVSGVIGFAFQGTNAHVILSRCGYACGRGVLRQGSGRHSVTYLSPCHSAADSACLSPRGGVSAAQTAAHPRFSRTDPAVLGPSAALAPSARAPHVVQRGRQAAAPFGTVSRRPRPRGTGRAAAASRGGAPAAAWRRHVRGLLCCQRHTARRVTTLLFALSTWALTSWECLPL
jgi:hypothetical protein